VGENTKVEKPGTEEDINFPELSRTGGLVNAYEAAKLAEQMTTKKSEPVKTKMKVKTEKKS
jgi:hypothetical protein